MYLVKLESDRVEEYHLTMQRMILPVLIDVAFTFRICWHAPEMPHRSR